MIKLMNGLWKKHESYSQNNIGLDKLENYMVIHRLIASGSFDQYANNRQITKKQQLKSILAISFLTANVIKYGLLSVYSKPWLLVYLGEFLHELYKINHLAMILSVGCSVSLAYSLIDMYLEQSGKFNVLLVFHQIQERNKEYLLNRRHMKKFNMICYMMFEFYIRRQIQFFLILVLSISSFLAVQA